MVIGTKQKMNYGAVWRKMGSGQIFYAPFPLCQQAVQSLQGTDLLMTGILHTGMLSQTI
jgi:hypothetical protein